MIADDQCTIRYCNDSYGACFFSMVENDLRKDYLILIHVILWAKYL